jgi:hypothetical protein
VSGWSEQQGCPRRPQAMHIGPRPTASRQLDPGAVQDISQQDWPPPPQVPQAPPTQTAPLGQS